MEEGERRGENCESREEEARGSTPSSGARLDLGVGLDLFAARLVDGVLKDTILESTETKIWSIPCSKECHNHEQEKDSHSSVGSLSWTPESCSAPGEDSTRTRTCSSHQSDTGRCLENLEPSPRTNKISQLSADLSSRVEPSGSKPLAALDTLLPRNNASLCITHTDLSNQNNHIEHNIDPEKPTNHHDQKNTNLDPLSTSPPRHFSAASSPREQTDLVHYRLSRQSREMLAEGMEERLEYRSVENLASSPGNTNQANGVKSSLRKGQSVNDVTVSDPCGSLKNSSGAGLLRSLGLRRPRDEVTQKVGDSEAVTPSRNKIKLIKKTLTNMFHFKPREAEGCERKRLFKIPTKRNKSLPPGKRALPPVPAVRLESRTPSPHPEEGAEGDVATPPEPHQPQFPALEAEDSNMDFAASIQKVKDHGWYWGPLSGESAERILAPEPDGSFVVRDSSDHHYIFSLTFKLNGFVRHVRIEHDQGNFSFGSFTKFKSTTIVDFIENAVEHSRSGRYLFFLHRRPVLGPMRVQLLHPVSRFKRVQSLQHLCRYVIVKHVRKDHLNALPVPNRIKLYLNTPFYYSEQVEAEAEEEAEHEAALMSLNTSVDSDDAETNSPTIVVDSQRSPRQRLAGEAPQIDISGNSTPVGRNSVVEDASAGVIESPAVFSTEVDTNLVIRETLISSAILPCVAASNSLIDEEESLVTVVGEPPTIMTSSNPTHESPSESLETANNNTNGTNI